VELLQEYIKEWCLRDEARVAEPIEDFVHGDEAAVGEVRVAGRMDEDLGVQAREREGSPLPSNNVDAGVVRPLSPSITEAMTVTSPPAIPPSSSFPTSKWDREGSVMSNTSSLGRVRLHKSPFDFLLTTSSAPAGIDGFYCLFYLNDRGTILKFGLVNEVNAETFQPQTIDDINDDIPLTNINDEQSTAEFRPAKIRTRQRGCDDFESLSPISKIEVHFHPLIIRSIP